MDRVRAAGLVRCVPGGYSKYVRDWYLHGATRNKWIAFSINAVLGAGAAAAVAGTGGAHLPVAVRVAIGLELIRALTKALKIYDWRPSLTLFTTMMA